MAGKLVGDGILASDIEWSRGLLDFLLPPRCLACGRVIARQGNLCGPCWHDLSFLVPPMCRRCGFPLPDAASEDPLCAACTADPPPFERLTAALRYEGAARRLILRFKHGQHTEGASLFAGWMREAGGDLIAAADAVIPVPLHRWRLLRRGYNQAALLAREIARGSGVPYRPLLLERHRATASQQGLGAAARRRNVTAGAFRIGRRMRERIRGARLLLVDDVFTTGATLAACARVLLDAGALRVDGLTLARVVRDESHPI